MLSLVLLALLAACEMLGPAEPLPDRAVAFAVPAVYLRWWAETEACSGREGRLDGIAWFAVPGASVFSTPQGLEVGRWSRSTDGSRIVVAGAYQGHELVVRHEMLHALLDRGDHPPAYFIARCHLTWASWDEARS